MKILFKRIANAIYWSKFTHNQEDRIIKILFDDDLSTSFSKANAICEYLDIPKRDNRQALANLLESTPLFD